MTEPESMTQVREEAGRGKGGKGKTIIKRSKTEATSRQDAPVESRQSQNTNTRQIAETASAGGETRDPQTIAKIQERAYALFEERGREHGRDLEHWLEAERQVTGSSDHCDR
jgi:hypothetical protein